MYHLGATCEFPFEGHPSYVTIHEHGTHPGEYLRSETFAADRGIFYVPGVLVNDEEVICMDG